MLITPEIDHRNRRSTLVVCGLILSIALIAGWFFWPLLLALLFCPAVYWLIRRHCLRRLAIVRQPFPSHWEEILQNHVSYFRALSDLEKTRFRQLVQIFLDEVRITGIRTEIDDTVRVLVAASAIIPIFGFHDWEYHRLGEVLIYPDTFGEKYQTQGTDQRNILGLVGMGNLSGVMILSKPSLLAGFDNPGSDNVGIHEFTHLIEKEEVNYGLPPEIPQQVVKQWIEYVAKEINHHSEKYINEYAYTNEHEFFAVLAEYFFKSPEVLQRKDPKLYGLLRDLFHQDTRSFLARNVGGARSKIRRSAPK